MAHQLIKGGLCYRVMLLAAIFTLVIGVVPAQAAPEALPNDEGNLAPVESPLPQGARTTFLFAEGSTQPPFDTWFLVENASNQTVGLTFTFFLQPSGTVVRNFVVGPTSRFSLFANLVVPNQAFSTRIDASAPIFAERAMYVSFDGHAVLGIPGAARAWLYAEGSTQNPFHTWILLQNPNNVQATGAVTYLLQTGQNVVQNFVLPPNSRTSIFVNQVLPNQAFSVEIGSDQPIVAERAMYRFPGNSATGVGGLLTPNPTWFFAEGRTSFRGLRADTFLLLENPNSNAASASVTLYRTDGATTTFTVTLPPRSRQTIFLNQVFSGSFGIQVNANAPIVAERSVFFGNEPLGAYATQGATALSTSWNLAEGETRAPFDELITILNPQGQTMGVHVDFLLETGQVIGRDFSIGPNRKLEIEVDNILTGANSARITTSLPSVVERTMFIFKGGRIGGTNTIGFSGS